MRVRVSPNLTTTPQTTPFNGSCTLGTVTGPTGLGGSCNLFASNTTCVNITTTIITNATTNATSTVVTTNCTTRTVVQVARNWYYDMCPDWNECAFNSTTVCSANSTCVDTQGSYRCVCNANFTANPLRPLPGHVSNPCLPICTSCVHGTCVAPDVCQCSPGYAGANCTVNCGCNFHANCIATANSSAFTCGPCLHNTTGTVCDRCAPGFFGDPRNGASCQPCNCNGHGVGPCDPVTGTCRCDAYTRGTTCSSCISQYYGDPRNGGTCFASCNMLNRTDARHWNNRMMLTGLTGALGSGSDLGSTYSSESTCMWYIASPLNASIITLKFLR